LTTGITSTAGKSTKFHCCMSARLYCWLFLNSRAFVARWAWFKINRNSDGW